MSNTGPRVDVRTLGADDWAAWRDLRLLALQESPAAYGSTYDRERAFPEQTWRDRLDDPESVSLLAAATGQPVGVTAGTPDGPGFARVVSMWVAPQARGRGVAHELLRRVEAWSDARGLRLRLDVTTDNVAARRSYERYGFAGTGLVRPLRPGGTELVEQLVLDR